MNVDSSVIIWVFWWGARVDDSAALEMLCARKGTVGSNPTPTAIGIFALLYPFDRRSVVI